VSEKHLFALFYKNLSSYVSGHISGGNGFSIEFRDEDLWHRLTKVLRIRAGQEIVFFDEHINTPVVILEQTFTKKNSIFINVGTIQKNQPLKPNITLMPCILKKDAFEDIIYASAQMGANKIIPILSDKVQREWGEKKERERLFNIMVAACEQSKNFFLPEICEPVKIQDICKQFVLRSSDSQTSLKIYFDPSGANFVDLLEKIKSASVNGANELEISLFFGPEGGLTEQEEKFLLDSGFETYALTPTILRAREAVIVGLGGVRSAIF
jgi:16S rRNA (uracil1498-N3)-methyltransferase